jgi:hypothetical protein
VSSRVTSRLLYAYKKCLYELLDEEPGYTAIEPNPNPGHTVPWMCPI